MPEQEARRIEGVLVPVTTPFDPVTAEAAPVSLRENLRRWFRFPLDGVVLFGTTGEGALLDFDEKLRLTEFARELVDPPRWLLAGVTADATRGAVRQSRELAEAGADAVLVHAPPYFGADLPPAALRDHFVAVADGSPVPVVVYNIPKHTHVSLEPGLVAELARHPNIGGLKDSAGELKRLAAFVEACGRKCPVLVGSGALLYPALELGAAGGIVAAGLLAPDLCTSLLARFRTGETREAGRLQERIGPVHKRIVARFGATGVKAALDLLGYAGGPPRAPLRPLPERARTEIARVLRDAALLE